MSRASFPIEVCKCIIQFADFDDLLALAVTCRALQETAESRIYHTLSVAHSILAYRLLSALVETPRLGALVRSFTLYRESGRGYNDRLLNNDDYWMRVREGLRAMTGLKSLLIIDPVYSHGWVLEPTDVEVEMVQDDNDDEDESGVRESSVRRSMREVVRDNFFGFKLREARLITKWDQHIASFLEGQDQLRRLYIPTVPRGLAHNALATLRPNSLPFLSVYDGPISLFKNLRGCPLTQVKLLLERMDDEDRDDAMLLDVYRVLKGLGEYKSLRSLAIVNLPHEGDDRNLGYAGRKASKALAYARNATGYDEAAGLSDEDVDMDREDDGGWEVCVECVRIIVDACPNLEFLAHIPLASGQKGRTALLRALQPLQKLSAIEVDVSHWLPQPSGPYQRMLLLEVRMVVPTLTRIFFYSNGERTSWEMMKRPPPVRIPPIKITIPGRAPPGTGESLTSANNSGSANAAPGSGNIHDGGQQEIGAGAAATAADSAPKSEIVEEEMDEGNDIIGSVDQWRSKYIQSSHPVDSLIFRYF